MSQSLHFYARKELGSAPGSDFARLLETPEAKEAAVVGALRAIVGAYRSEWERPDDPTPEAEYEYEKALDGWVDLLFDPVDCGCQLRLPYRRLPEIDGAISSHGRAIDCGRTMLIVNRPLWDAILDASLGKLPANPEDPERRRRILVEMSADIVALEKLYRERRLFVSIS